MSENKVNNLLGVSMDKIKEMVDVNTVIGDPITAPDGTTVIPVSRVSYGFAGGGSDLPSKAQPEKGLFAGGSGAGINITDAYGSMIVDIGAGMTDIAVLSLGRVIVSDAAKLGGDHFDDAIIRYLRRKHNLLIGERTAEELKINIGSAMPRAEQMYLDVTGRNLISGLPKLMRITSDEIYEAIDDPLTALIEAIHAVLEHTPAELAADVFDNGIVLSGGGARLSGLADAISTALKVDCRVADNPQECVATGCGLTLENLAEFGRYLNDGRRR